MKNVTFFFMRRRRRAFSFIYMYIYIYIYNENETFGRRPKGGGVKYIYIYFWAGAPPAAPPGLGGKGRSSPPTLAGWYAGGEGQNKRKGKQSKLVARLVSIR